MRCVKHCAVQQRATGKILAIQFATAVEENRNLVLLSAAVEATCFARILCGVFHRVMFQKTCHAVFEKISGQVA